MRALFRALSIFAIITCLPAVADASFIEEDFATPDVTGRVVFDNADWTFAYPSWGWNYYGMPRSYVAFTYRDHTYDSTIYSIQFEPNFGGEVDLIAFHFDEAEDFGINQVDFYHTPPGTLPSYTLDDFDIRDYNDGGIFLFSGSAGGPPADVEERFAAPAAAPEPAATSVLGISFVLFGLIRFRKGRFTRFAASAG